MFFTRSKNNVKRQTLSYLVTGLTCFTLAPDLLFSLPQEAETASGTAEFTQSDPSTLIISTSDKAVINYKSFDIGKQEKVQFLQPSKSSTVLNRVKGKDPSKILGNLEGNGRIFLVNPKGVYFGPSAIVNVGSLIVSTLDIADQDFLEDKFQFSLGSESHSSEILNQGLLSASSEGSIVLLAPHIRNEGIIEAKAGKILLAAGEAVTLDFSGDGLLSFSVEGSLKDAVIEHLGQIQAPGGDVYLRLGAAEKVIQSIVNYDGVEEGAVFLEEEGIIKLVSLSAIEAKNIALEGSTHSQIVVEGTVDASDLCPGAVGGTIHVLGEEVRVEGAHINASGDQSGGTILIGGDFQGQGDLFRSQKTIVDADSTILADAITQGNGGQVIIWSDGTTLFQGNVFARGGELGGQGGLVETSGKERLQVLRYGSVNTLAPKGQAGEWLLDPPNIIINTTGGGSLANAQNCAFVTDVTILPSDVVTGLSTGNVTLCATSSITLAASSNITSTTANTLTFQASGGNITTTLNSSITTASGQVVFNGVIGTNLNAVVLGTTGIVIDTTGSASAGANVSFNSTINGAQALTVTAGTGTINVSGVIGGTTALSSLALTGNGGVTLASIGASTSVRGVSGPTSVTSSTRINLNGGNYFANAQTYTGPVTLGAVNTIDSNNAPLSFSSTIDSSHTSVWTAGTSTVNISGVIGGTTALTFLNITGDGGVTLSGIGGASPGVTSGVRVTSAASITLNGGTYNAGVPTYAGPVILGANTTITSNSTAIQFSSGINGAHTLTANAGTSTFSAGGTIGDTTALTSLTLTGNGGITLTGIGTSTAARGVSGATNVTSTASIILNGGNYFANAQTYTGPVTLGTDTTIDSNNAALSFTNTINGAHALTATAGTTLAISNIIGATAALSSLTLTGNGGITLTSIGTSTAARGVSGSTSIASTTGITLNGGNYFANAQTYTGPVSLGVNTTIDSNNNAISLTSTINGAHTLTATAGTNTLSIGGTIGGTTALSSLTLTGNGGVTLTSIGASTAAQGVSGATSITSSAGITLNGGNYFANAQTYTGPVTLGAGATINSNNNTISFTAAISGSSNLIVNAGTSTISLAAGSTISLGDVSTNTSLTLTTSAAQNFPNTVNLVGGLTVQTNTPTAQSVTFNNTTSIGGNINVAGLTTSAGAYAVSLLGGGTVTGTASFGNTGQLNLYGITGNPLNFTNALNTTAASSTHLSGTVETSGTTQPITMGVVVLDGTTTLTTTNSNITINNTIDGAQGLTVTAGTASVIVSGAIGTTTPLSSLSVTGNAGVTLTSIGSSTATRGVSGATSITSTTGITLNGGNYFANAQTYTGPVTLGASTTVDSNNAPLSFTSTINGAQSLTATAGINTLSVSGIIGGTAALNSLTLTGNGGVTLTNIGSSTAARGISGATSVTSTTGITLNGGNYFANAQTYTGPVTLGAGTTVDSNNAPLSFTSTINGAQTLTATAGTSTLSVSGVIGGAAALSSLTLTGNGSITLTSIGSSTSARGVSGATNVTSTIGITLNGGNYFANAQTYTGPASLGADTTVDSNNTALSFTSTINGSHALTATAGTSTLAVSGTIGGTAALSSLTLTGNGGITLTGIGTSTSARGVTGATSIASMTSITLNGGNYFANAQTYTGPVILGTGTTTDSNGHAISFNSTINDTTAGSQSLTITAGAGAVNFGIIGGSAALGAFSVTSGSSVTANSITTHSGMISIAPAITLATTSIFNTTSGPTSGASITLGSVDATTPGGQGLTLTAGTGSVTYGNIGSITALSSFSVTTTNPIHSGSVTTQGSSLSFTQPIILNTTAVFDTTGRGAVAGASITLNTVDATIPESQGLTLTPGTGSVSFSTIGGSSPLASLTATSFSTIAQNSSVQTAGQVAYTGGPINIGGNITTTTAGTGTITITGPVNLTASSTISSNNAAIAFSSTINGNVPFVVNAGTSTLILSGAMGAAVPLSSLTLTGNGGVTLTSIGASTVARGVSGATSITSAAGITLNGGNYFANAQTYAGPVTLGASTLVDSNANPLIFNSTLNGTSPGSQNLSLTAGNADLTFGGSIGGNIPLGALTIVSVASTALPTIQATSVTQSAGTGTTIFNGTISTSGSGGINVSGNIFDINSTFATAGGGGVIIDNTGMLTIAAGANMSLSGAFNQNGTGPVATAGSITTTGSSAINFSSPITLTGNIMLDSSSGSGNITFFNTVAGNTDLTLAAGTGTIAFQNTINLGSGVLTVTSGTVTGTHPIQSDAITVIGSGTITFTMPLVATGPNGITVSTGPIFLGNTMDASVLSLTAQGSILNVSLPVALNITGPATFNAIGGDVGTPASPIEINTPDLITVGADPAYFQGSPNHICVDYIFSNAPSSVTFNGIVIFNCNSPPPPPPPSPITTVVITIPPRNFYIQGIYSSWNNLSNYYYFVPDLP